MYTPGLVRDEDLHRLPQGTCVSELGMIRAVAVDISLPEGRMVARDTQSLEWDTEWDLWLSGSITLSSLQTVWPGAILCKTGICIS